jgi:hypothetical protein
MRAVHEMVAISVPGAVDVSLAYDMARFLASPINTRLQSIRAFWLLAEQLRIATKKSKIENDNQRVCFVCIRT